MDNRQNDPYLCGTLLRWHHKNWKRKDEIFQHVCTATLTLDMNLVQGHKTLFELAERLSHIQVYMKIFEALDTCMHV